MLFRFFPFGIVGRKFDSDITFHEVSLTLIRELHSSLKQDIHSILDEDSLLFQLLFLIEVRLFCLFDEFQKNREIL